MRPYAVLLTSSWSVEGPIRPIRQVAAVTTAGTAIRDVGHSSVNEEENALLSLLGMLSVRTSSDHRVNSHRGSLGLFPKSNILLAAHE